MAGVPSGARSPTVGGLVLAMLLASGPGMAAAADESSVILARGPLSSVVSDLDGDGAREVVAVLPDSFEPDLLVVEAWRNEGATWASLGQVRLTRRGGDGTLVPAEHTTTGVGILTLADGSDSRTIVATTGASERDGPGGCCLALSVLALVDGRLQLDMLDGPILDAEGLQALDMDGDGTDELLVIHEITYPEDGPPTGRYAIARLGDDGFGTEPLDVPEGFGGWFSGIGDMDGVAGDDLLFQSSDARQLLRIVMDQGLSSEVAELEFSRPGGGGIAGMAGGAFLWVDELGASVVRWPRGDAPDVVAALESRAFPNILVVGDGPTARVVETIGFDGAPGDVRALRVYDLRFRLLERIPIPDGLSRLWNELTTGQQPIQGTERYLWPLSGPLRAGPAGGRPAFLGFGSLVAVEPDGTLDVRPVRPILGGGPLGYAGAGDAWLVIASDWFGDGRSAYLGNVGFVNPTSTLAAGRLADLLDLEADAGPDVTLSGATMVVDGEDRRVFTSADSFEVTVPAADGSLVIVTGGRTIVAAEVSGDAATVTVTPPGGRNEIHDFELGVFLVGPMGTVTDAAWQATALRVEPAVTASATVEPWSLRATVNGRVDGEATVTIDGHEVTTSPSGRFRLEVDAPAWPREILVLARDPLGREVSQRLEVIGFVDYRGLPWIPIVGILTVVAGLVLFVRTPSLRPEERLRPDGDGMLEEIDGDLV